MYVLGDDKHTQVTLPTEPVVYVSLSDFVPFARNAIVEDIEPPASGGLSRPQTPQRSPQASALTPPPTTKFFGGGSYVRACVIGATERVDAVNIRDFGLIMVQGNDIIYKGTEKVAEVSYLSSQTICHISLIRCPKDALKDILAAFVYKHIPSVKTRTAKCLEVLVCGSDHVPATSARRSLILVPRRVEDIAPVVVFPATQKAMEVFSPDSVVFIEPGDEITIELVDGTIVPPSVTLHGRNFNNTVDRIFIPVIPEQYVYRRGEIVEKTTNTRLAMISYVPDINQARKIVITIPRMGKSLSDTQFVDIVRSICFENKLEAMPMPEKLIGRRKSVAVMQARSRAASQVALAKERPPPKSFSSGKKKPVLHVYAVCRVTFDMYENDTKLHTIHYVMFDEAHE